MGNLAVIPARGGSKRIPGKNIRPFLGEPIIAYPIRTALSSGLFDEVMVSTDDDAIARTALQFGATVPFRRSAERANDTAVLAEVVREVIDRYVESGRVFDAVCCILPTAPLMTVPFLQQGLQLLQRDSTIDSVRPVVRFSYPIQRAVRLQGDRVEMFWPEHRLTRSQDLEPAFHDAGQFYWMRLPQGLSGEQRAAFEIPERYSQDIDTEEDWMIAEAKFRALADERTR